MFSPRRPAACSWASTRGVEGSPQGYAIRHKVDKPPAFNGKVAYDGRLNAEKALAAIPGLVD